MALPIKSNNTQQGCNPISSNCVVWQGPDIPCINLCTGDSVSDVVAKMATELCEIANQLDISLLDLSCFNPLCPTPQNFRDVIQIIIDKICALENGTGADGINTSGCPSDCEVAVAPCLQYTDFLGNTVVSLPIKDYVILIGNRICTILTSIANLQTQIDSLDVRVTNLENGSGGGGTGSSFNVTSACVTSGTVSLQEYITALDAAFCELEGSSGSLQDYINASSIAQCVTGGSVQMSNPPQLVGALPGWIASAANGYQQIQNLWVAICDIRTGITNIRTQLDQCCAPAAVCPTSLPRVTFELNKDAPANDLFFRVSGTSNPGNTGIILPDGTEWKLIRFEGIVIPSANNSIQNINQNIPNPAFSSTVNYTGASNSNRLTQLSGIASSLNVTVQGTFYWENLETGQVCTNTPTNVAPIDNVLVPRCASLTGLAIGTPSANFSITPTTVTCNAVTGATITVNLTGFSPITGTGVTGAFTTVNISYTNTSNTPVTLTQNFSTTSLSVAISNIDCGSNVTLTLTGINQNGVIATCNSSAVIAIPLPAAP
jgi:hypothetical protein